MTDAYEPDDDEELIRALRRARRALGALETARESVDIERARKGAMHEIETALRLLGEPYRVETGRPALPPSGFLAAHEAFSEDVTP